MPPKSSKPKAKYMKIPVSPETYGQVRLIADANDRGMGDQVSAWAKRDLPPCSHIKKPVTIIYQPNLDVPIKDVRIGFYCPTCQKVFDTTQTAPQLAVEPVLEKAAA